MAGFDNDVVYGKNVDFSGASTTGGNATLVTDAQLLIGSTALNAGNTHINVGTLTSPDSSITFGYSSPNITATVAGGTTSLKTLSDDVNTIVTPAAGNIQLQGHVNDALGKFSTVVAGTNLLKINPMTGARWIVDPLGFNGTHTTIQGAITSASSGETVFIMSGTFTEDLTLKAGVDLVAFGGDHVTPNVTIIGNATMSGAGTTTITNIRLQTNTGAFLTVSGAGITKVNLFNCYLNASAHTGISFTNSNASSFILINNCYGDIGTTGIALFAHSSAGNLSIQYSNFTNSGASTTANTISAGSLNFFYSSLKNPITSSGTSAIGYELSDFSTVAQNVISLTIGGSGSASISNCRISSGTASAISVGAAATVGIAQTDIFSSNTNATTGAGATVVNCISYTGTSITSNVTTQTGGTLTGLTNISPSAGYLGERIVSAVTGGTPANNTATTLTSIVLTPGVWDLCGITSFSYSGNNTASVMSLSPTNNTLTGNIGDQEDQFSQTNVAGFIVGLSVPGWRVAVTTNTTYFLVVFTLFSTGAATVNGRISATRVG